MDKVNVAKGPSRAADKGDATTRAAREIIRQEVAARDAKTARLKALRLAKEAEVAAQPPKAAPERASSAKPAARKAAAKKPAARKAAS
ncbi:MAG: hypothetical protein DI565_08055 [Ancylobacter novellus]|uniref:Uncharacterized protein n=1 Tax=Ancylobacter novellus TaxID=921 RepID=A0A2W5KFG7_ANCNO|nr:MAG: hypothetical protein DI565_08055 [Ancylobacter novellus]